jgi:hypothetical protein
VCIKILHVNLCQRVLAAPYYDGLTNLASCYEGQINILTSFLRICIGILLLLPIVNIFLDLLLRICCVPERRSLQITPELRAVCLRRARCVECAVFDNASYNDFYKGPLHTAIGLTIPPIISALEALLRKLRIEGWCYIIVGSKFDALECLHLEEISFKFEYCIGGKTYSKVTLQIPVIQGRLVIFEKAFLEALMDALQDVFNDLEKTLPPAELRNLLYTKFI